MCRTRLSSKQLASMALAFVAIVGLMPLRAGAQTDRPWEHPAGPACYELWFQTSLTRLNAHNGSAALNGIKPYTVSRWGLIVARNQAQDRAPDNWGEFGGNKYWWLWAHFTRSASWGDADWNAAGVPMPRPFILDCIARGGPGGAGATGTTAGPSTAVVPTAPTAVPPELRGPWLFGRIGRAQPYGTIEFGTSWDARVGAYRVGGSYKHDNETYWRIDGSDLLLIHKNGTVSSRLHRLSANRWEGPFLLPGGPLTHFVERAGSATGTAAATGGRAIEPGIDRAGGDYRNIVFGPEHCRDLCNQEPQCRAWTFTRPGTQGEHARCWLKSSVPAARTDARATSGVKGAR